MHLSPAPGPRLPAPAKLMVRVPNWVGDAVMAVPALRELRRIFNEARIALVAKPWGAGLFEGEGLAVVRLRLWETPESSVELLAE